MPFDPQSIGSKPFGPNHPAVVAFATRNVDNALDFYLSFSGSRNREQAITREAERLARDCFDNHWLHHLSQADVDALVKEGRLRDFTHDFVSGEGWKPKDPPYCPTAEEVNVWSIGGMGHDCINQSICVRERCCREGVSDVCPTCKGIATDPDDAETAKLHDEWEPTDPPSGEAYQLWETVSEGSPITPAFADPSDLARWCVAHQFDDKSLNRLNGGRWNRLAGGEEELTFDQWLKFITGPGWAPSAVRSPEKGIQSGVSAVIE